MLKIVVVGVAFIYVNNMSQDGMLECQSRYVVSHSVWRTPSQETVPLRNSVILKPLSVGR